MTHVGFGLQVAEFMFKGLGFRVERSVFGVEIVEVQDLGLWVK